MREAFEDLDSVETAWNSFLSEVDAALHGSAGTAALSAGQGLQTEIKLRNARWVQRLQERCKGSHPSSDKNSAIPK